MKQALILTIVLYVLLYVLPLGVRPLVVPDESRYAEIPREMIASGDWIVPRLNGLRYFEKPPLGYWVTAICMQLWGETRSAVRLPPAVAAGFNALVLAWFVFKPTQNKMLTFLSAAVLLTSVEVFALGIYNVLDSLFAALVTASFVLFYFAFAAQGRAQRIAWLAFFGIALGLAFLAKGFLAFALPAIVIAPFLIIERRWKAMLTWPWLPLAIAASVILPWGLAIHRREPDFWRYFVWVEHIQRFASRENAQHAEPFWYYIPVLLGGFLPWSFLLPAAWRGLRAAQRWPSWLRFAGLAFLAPFLFFSLSRGKIGTYILPCFPWLAVCVATGLNQVDSPQARIWVKSSIGLSALVAFALAAAATVVLLVVPGRLPYAEHEMWKWVLITAGFGFWSLSAFLAVITSSDGERWTLYALSPALLMAAAHWAAPETFINRKAPEAFLRQFTSYAPPEAVIVTDNNLVHLVCWVFKRSDVYLLQSRGELDYGLRYPDAQDRLLTVETFNDLIRRHAPEGPVVLIAEKHDLEKYWKGRIPEPGFRAENEKFFIATFRTPLRK